MTDVVGRSTIIADADASGVKAGMAEARSAVKDYEKSAVQASANVGEAMGKATQTTVDGVSRMDQATKRFINSLERQSQAAGKTRSEYLELRAAQYGVSEQAAPFIAKIRESEKSVGTLGLSAKQTTQAMRLLPAQITDIVTGLVSGQPAYLVAIQQGGQLKDSFGGIVPAAKALASIFTPLNLAIGVGAAAVGGLVAAYVMGAREADAYAKALILTGNAAGSSTEMLAANAREIARVAGTQHAAADVVAQLAASGAVASSSITQVGLAIVEMDRAGGAAVKELVKDFVSLGEDPLKASERLNQQYHYLTLSVYDQIRALNEAGRTADAAAAAQAAFAQAQQDRAAKLEENLGTIQRAWNAVKNAAADAWDAMLNLGRQQSLDQQLAEAQKKLQDISPRGSLFGRYTQSEIDDQKALVGQLQDRIREQTRWEAKISETAKTERDAVKARQENAKWTEAARTQQEKLNTALDRYRANLEKIRAAGGNVSAEQVAREEAAIRASFASKSGGGGGHQSDDAATRMLQRLRQTAAALQAQINGEQELSAAEKARVEYEQSIADLKTKKILTADQKSLLSNQGSLRAQLQKNVALEKEADMQAFLLKLDQKRVEEAKKFSERADQIQQQLALSRQTRVDQYQQQLDAFGMGDQERSRIAAQVSIVREYQRAQAELLKATPTSLLGSDKYVGESMKIKSALDQALQDQKDYFAAVDAAQTDWSKGASRALKNYSDEVGNVAAQSQRTFSDVFHGLEDTLTDFVTKGKGDFKSLFQSILADINRMTIRTYITGPLSQLLMGSSLFGGGGPVGAALTGVGSGAMPYANGAVFGSGGVKKFASGDIVSSPTLFSYGTGRTGVMGEAGYEAVMPVTRGPDGKLGVKSTSGGFHFTQVVNIDSRTDQAAVAEAVQQGGQIVKAEIIDAIGRHSPAF